MIAVAREAPHPDDIVKLIRRSDALMAGLHPAESNRTVDIGALAQPNVCFFVAREAGRRSAAARWCLAGGGEPR